MEGHASTTILIGEVNANFKPWGHPANWRDPAKGINRSPDGFGGRPGAGGANFLMADGSVKFISERTSLDVLRALASPKREDKGDLAALEAVLETAR
jgi:prepilin-type processing-associated H-X9-DG protein